MKNIEGMTTMKCNNRTVANALAANAISKGEAAALADLIKSKPWDDPKYKAEEKAELERRIRRVYGDKAVDEWKRALKTSGMWHG